MASQSTKQMPMQTPQDLFVHELSDIHSAEQIIAQMLREAAGLVSEPQLQQALQQHLQETEQQARNVELVIQGIGQPPHPVTCHAVKGLQQELKEVQKSKPSPDVLDGVILGGAQKTEHYEIAAYEGLIRKARAMGQQQAVQLLEQNLAQEQKTLQLLTQIGEQLIQRMASMAQQPGLGQAAQATQF